MSVRRLLLAMVLGGLATALVSHQQGEEANRRAHAVKAEYGWA